MMGGGRGFAMSGKREGWRWGVSADETSDGVRAPRFCVNKQASCLMGINHRVSHARAIKLEGTVEIKNTLSQERLL